MIWASIDPGLNHVGIALWSDATLLHATLIRSKLKSKVLSERVFWLTAAVRRYIERRPDSLEPVTVAVIEMPQTYKGKASKGDTNDLLNLSLVVGALIAAVPTVHLVYPREWKGSVPGDVMTERIRSKLSIEEKSKIECSAKSLEHNTIDAIGLGKWYVSKKALLTK